jgi:hypothetical protein
MQETSVSKECMYLPALCFVCVCVTGIGIRNGQVSSLLCPILLLEVLVRVANPLYHAMLFY